MDVLTMIGAVIGFVVYAYLMYRQNELIDHQNRIFEEQNRLMSKKKGATMLPLSKTSRLKNYWPMATIGALKDFDVGTAWLLVFQSKRTGSD